MLEHELRYYHLLAYKGSLSPDGNINVHAATLRDHLDKLRTAKSQSSIARIETVIEDEARQVARCRSSGGLEGGCGF
jgi:hypothetical protein